jgi:hypothetical protein
MIVAPGPAGPLPALVREVESHVAAGGWDQPVRLFALVGTAELLAREPQLARLLGRSSAGDGADPSGLTPVEQEELPGYASLDELLAGIAWPDEVRGAALAVERVVLPPEAEHDLPDDEAAALGVLREHPERRDVRLVVAVLRDGAQACVVRARGHDADEDLVSGPDLVPGLTAALAATLKD